MTLSPEFNPMRTRSRSHNTDPDTNETPNPDQLQPLPEDPFALNDEALSDHLDTKDVGDRKTASVNNETASSLPSSISQKAKKDDTLKIDEIDLKVFEFDPDPPRKRGRPRKRKLGNSINDTLSNDTSTLKSTQHESKAAVDIVSKAEDRKEKEPVDNKEAAQVIENKETKDTHAEEPVKRRGRKKKTPTPTKKPSPRGAPRNNAAAAAADTDTKPSSTTPIKWTLPHLLHNKDSMLTTAVNLKNNVTMDLINKLPEKDRDELLKLLPPADIDFVKRNHDDEDDTSSSIIVAKSLDEHEQLSNQPETYKPIISQRLISPSFTQAIEDFQVNLQHGRYDNNPKPATGRGRKRKEVVVEEQHDDFKDEHFEAYWGERLKKRSKKGTGGRR